MEDLKFDFTTKKGLNKTQNALSSMLTSGYLHGLTATRTSKDGTETTVEMDIKGTLKELADFVKHVFDRILDLFDDTKKLQRQMDLAIKTIEIARAVGAEKIEITLNSKNSGALELYLEESEAKIGGKYEKDNSMTYVIEF